MGRSFRFGERASSRRASSWAPSKSRAAVGEVGSLAGKQGNIFRTFGSKLGEPRWGRSGAASAGCWRFRETARFAKETHCRLMLRAEIGKEMSVRGLCGVRWRKQERAGD